MGQLTAENVGSKGCGVILADEISESAACKIYQWIVHKVISRWMMPDISLWCRNEKT